MAKKRTKRQKSNPKAHLALSYLYKIADRGEDAVKREFTYKPRVESVEIKNAKKANLTASDTETNSIKRNIVKSLALSSLILSLEVVLYFVWK